MNSGKELFQFKMQEPCRAVNLSVGEGLMAFTTDAFMGTPPSIHICKLEEDLSRQSSKPALSIDAPKGRVTRVYWTELNRCLLTSHDGGWVRKWDSEVRGSACWHACPCSTWEPWLAKCWVMVLSGRFVVLFLVVQQRQQLSTAFQKGMLQNGMLQDAMPWMVPHGALHMNGDVINGDVVNISCASDMDS